MKHKGDSAKLIDRGKMLLERNEIDQALPIFMDVLSKNFADPIAMYFVGTCYLARNLFGPAAVMLKQAASMRAFPEAWQNLGNCFRGVNEMALAEEMWRKALEFNITDGMRGDIFGNLAGIHTNNGTPEKARAYYQEALKYSPNHPHITFQSCYPELELGNWRDGWRLYDVGFASQGRAYRNYLRVANYEPGMSLKGKRVIVWGDQGIGDEIMNASCIPDLIEEVGPDGHVFFDCHPRLVSLFERSFGIECHGTRKNNSLPWIDEAHADLSVPVTSLMTRYRSDGSFPRVPYIDCSMRISGQRPRIGIAWSGGYVRTRADLRSMTLHDLAPMLTGALGDCDVYSLEYKEEAAQECARFEEDTGIRVRHLPGKVQEDDYSVTADFVAGLDLVVSVCTSVVHLAGAMGVPCWCLVPSKPAWRYGMTADTMPFYSSVKLYRQQDGEDWQPAIARVTADLVKRFDMKEAAE